MTALRRSIREPECFSVFYRCNAEDVLIFLTRRTYDPQIALDLTAETFAQAFAKRHRFRGTTDAESRAWVFAIARNLHLLYARRGRIEDRAVRRLSLSAPRLDEQDVELVGTLAGLAELREEIRASYASLPEPQQAAIRLRVLDELPYREVASELGVSEGVARARVSRGLRKLRLILQPEGPTCQID